jgi:hypothetical protein
VESQEHTSYRSCHMVFMIWVVFNFFFAKKSEIPRGESQISNNMEKGVMDQGISHVMDVNYRVSKF